MSTLAYMVLNKSTFKYLGSNKNTYNIITVIKLKCGELYVVVCVIWFICVFSSEDWTLWELYDRPGIHTLLIKYLYNYQHLQWKMCTCISPQLMQVFLRSNLHKWSPRSVRLYLLNLACCHAYSDNANMLMFTKYNVLPCFPSSFIVYSMPTFADHQQKAQLRQMGRKCHKLSKYFVLTLSMHEFQFWTDNDAPWKATITKAITVYSVEKMNVGTLLHKKPFQIETISLIPTNVNLMEH